MGKDVICLMSTQEVMRHGGMYVQLLIHIATVQFKPRAPSQ